jgi:hypothetical protein
VKALTKEKENVLIHLELVNLKNESLLQFEKLKKKTIEVEKEKLLKKKSIKEIYSTCKHSWRWHRKRGRI